jgi:twitching motility protein PilT
LVLVVGPTGSGKSTTLAAMTDHINQTALKHILTVEDPVEFVYEPKQCLVTQREVGRDTPSFADALKGALREDPDVILLGEMRDLETIRLALTAAETGHLVLATLHTATAPQAIERIVDVFPGEERDLARTLLADVLRAVVAQQLLPRSDGKGRVAAHEILVGTPAVRNLIRESKTAQLVSVMQTGQQQGMQTMAQSLERLSQVGVLGRV